MKAAAGTDHGAPPLSPPPGSSLHRHREEGGSETLADLGEWELIRRLGAFAPPSQFADDAALLEQRTGNGEAAVRADLVVNTDVLVEGVHFSDATTAPGDAGWRAAAANLSDLAAMGCTQVLGITVGLVAPGSTPWSWVEGVYCGMGEALRAFGGVLLGGDCSGGNQRILALTAIGRLPAAPTAAGQPETTGPPGSAAQELDQDRRSEEPSVATSQPPGSEERGAWGAIRRRDGRPGDVLVCTGPHGLSRLGLALLLGELPAPERSGRDRGATAARQPGESKATADPLPHPDPTSALVSDPIRLGGTMGLDPELLERAIRAHQRPTPRFDAVRILNSSRPEQLPWRVGGCDSSDGLAAAVQAIAATSGCAARLEREWLPLEPAMAALPEAESWCLGGGEDFELVLALEPAWAETLLAALPGASVIGQLEVGTPGDVGWADGSPWPAAASGSGGYRHFS